MSLSVFLYKLYSYTARPPIWSIASPATHCRCYSHSIFPDDSTSSGSWTCSSMPSQASIGLTAPAPTSIYQPIRMLSPLAAFVRPSSSAALCRFGIIYYGIVKRHFDTTLFPHWETWRHRHRRQLHVDTMSDWSKLIWRQENVCGLTVDKSNGIIEHGLKSQRSWLLSHILTVNEKQSQRFVNDWEMDGEWSET